MLIGISSAAKINRLKKVLENGNFTSSSGRLRQRNWLKCVPHVQHDYFSSSNQSDHCFLASSLSVALNSLLFTHTQRLSHFYQRKLKLLQIQCFTRLTFHQLFSWANTDDLDRFWLRLLRFRISGSLNLSLTHGKAFGCERSFKRMQDKPYHVHHVIMDFFAHFHIGFVFFSILCLKKKGRNLVTLGSD